MIPVLIATRVGMGMGEAGLFPATYELFGRWIPQIERARASSRFTSGIPIGTVIGLAASGWLIGRYGWPMAFYVFGLAGLLWMLLWLWQVQNDPRSDARVGAAELGLIESIRTAGDSTTEHIPWRRLLLSRPVLAIVVGQFANGWTLYVLLSWLPSYFRDVQGLSIANSGLFSAGPWLAMAVAMNIGGSVSDRMIRGGMSITKVRKIMQCGGLILSGLFLLATHGAHTPAMALILLMGALAALGFTWCGFAPGILDVAPRHSGLLVGYSNTIGQIPGIIGVAVTGWLVDMTAPISPRSFSRQPSACWVQRCSGSSSMRDRSSNDPYWRFQDISAHRPRNDLEQVHPITFAAADGVAGRNGYAARQIGRKLGALARIEQLARQAGRPGLVIGIAVPLCQLLADIK